MQITYSDGKQALGTDYFSISDPIWQDKMQKRGRELGAKFAYTKNRMSVYGIIPKDKMPLGLTEKPQD